MKSDNRFMSPGDIYRCDLGEGIGSIQGGMRPVVFCGNNKEGAYSTVAHVVPLSKIDKEFPLHYMLSKDKYPMLEYDSNALCEQFTLVSKEQIRNKIGRLEMEDLYEIVRLCHQNLPFNIK